MAGAGGGKIFQTGTPGTDFGGQSGGGGDGQAGFGRMFCRVRTSALSVEEKREVSARFSSLRSFRNANYNRTFGRYIDTGGSSLGQCWTYDFKAKLTSVGGAVLPTDPEGSLPTLEKNVGWVWAEKTLT